MITFQNFLKMYWTPQYLEKVSKIQNKFKSLTLFRPQSNNCLVRVIIAVKQERVRGRGVGAFLFAEAIPFIRGYYMILDILSIDCSHSN